VRTPERPRNPVRGHFSAGEKPTAAPIVRHGHCMARGKGCEGEGTQARSRSGSTEIHGFQIDAVELSGAPSVTSGEMDSDTVAIPRLPVESSSLASVGYDEDSQILAVEFAKTHDVYHYTDVPPEIHEQLVAAESVGRFFMTEVRPNFEGKLAEAAPFELTPEYLAFVKENIHITYIPDPLSRIDSDEQLKIALKQIKAVQDAGISLDIDFEVAIDSYADRTRGVLRTVQIGACDLANKLVGPKQWVIDCYYVNPSKLTQVFGRPGQKNIHYLFFEQDWTMTRFGTPIVDIFDSCIAWRGIQAYMANSLRAADYATRGDNIPRHIRRVLGCTLNFTQVNEEYNDLFGAACYTAARLDAEAQADAWKAEHTEGTGEDAVTDWDGFQESMTAWNVDDHWNDEVPCVSEAGGIAWGGYNHGEDVEGKSVTDIENGLVFANVLPRVPEMLDSCGYKMEVLEPDAVIEQLKPHWQDEIADGEVFRWNESHLASDDPAIRKAIAFSLITASSELRATELPKLFPIPEEGIDDETRASLEEQNASIQVERDELNRRKRETPFITADRVSGEFRDYPDFTHSKRSNTAFHPNTLAKVTHKLLGFQLPKTEQAGYWGRAKLTREQIIYAALDVAVLPYIERDTKHVIEKLGIEKQIYEDRIGVAQVRVAERVAEKLASGEFQDHFDRAHSAIFQADNVAHLDRTWDSIRQLAIVAPSYVRLKRCYLRRRNRLENGKPVRTQRPRTPRETARPF
jgi:hypothetical protein